MILTSRGKCNFFISSKIFGEAVPGAPLFQVQLHFNWTGQGCARCERIDWNLSGYVRVLHNMHNCTWEDVVMHMGCAENLDFTKCLFLQQKFKSHFIPMASQNKGKRELDNKFWWALFFYLLRFQFQLGCVDTLAKIYCPQYWTLAQKASHKILLFKCNTMST